MQSQHNNSHASTPARLQPRPSIFLCHSPALSPKSLHAWIACFDCEGIRELAHLMWVGNVIMRVGGSIRGLRISEKQQPGPGRWFARIPGYTATTASSLHVYSSRVCINVNISNAAGIMTDDLDKHGECAVTPKSSKQTVSHTRACMQQRNQLALHDNIMTAAHARSMTRIHRSSVAHPGSLLPSSWIIEGMGATRGSDGEHHEDHARGLGRLSVQQFTAATFGMRVRQLHVALLSFPAAHRR